MKRNFALLALALAGSHAHAQAPAPQPRPNIVFVLTDDQRFDALGYAGNQLAHTPEMDRLARQGTYFSHAMSSTPICAASRASILSGTYERTHRFNFSAGQLREEYMANAYPRLLRKAGYRIGFYGKYGVKYDRADLLFDEYETYDRNGAYPDRRGYFYKTLGGDTVHLTRYTGQQGLNFIDSAEPGQPFCLQLSFSAPHAHDNAPEQYFWQPQSDALLADTTVPPPALQEDRYFDVLPKGVKAGLNRERWHWRFDTPEKYQHSVKGYLRMLSEVDAEIGRLRAKLEARGLADNTVFVIMGDNGYFLGERQLAGKWLMYDNSVRVPLIVYDPRSPKHQDSDVLANNVDVPATLLDLAGLPQPNTYQGTSLLPLVQAKTSRIGRDTALIEHLWEFDKIPPSEGIRTADYKYFRYVNDARDEELYDLRSDPWETRNLAKEQKFRGKLSVMRAGLDRQILRYSDRYSAGPTGLMVDFVKGTKSIATSNRTPDLNWVLPKGVKSQLAYQIIVSSIEALSAQHVGDVWDSGRVPSRDMQAAYAGPNLSTGETYHWRVRFYDEVNRLSAYSAPRQFRIAEEVPLRNPSPASVYTYAEQLDHYATGGDYASVRQQIDRLMANPPASIRQRLQLALMVDADYRYTGNPGLIQRHYESLKVVLTGLRSGPNRDDLLSDTTAVNVLYDHNLRVMSGFASMLAEPGDALEFDALAAEFRRASFSRSVDSDDVDTFSTRAILLDEHLPSYVIHCERWGIRPRTPGFGVASIYPRLGDMEAGDITVPTIRGEIEARYRKTNNGGVYAITLPPGMAGEFRVDMREGQVLTIGGLPVNPAFATVRLASGATELEVGVYGY